jgi:hypothetical protein
MESGRPENEMPNRRRWLWALLRPFVPHNAWGYQGRPLPPGAVPVPPPGPAADVPLPRVSD